MLFVYWIKLPECLLTTGIFVHVRVFLMRLSRLFFYIPSFRLHWSWWSPNLWLGQLRTRRFLNYLLLFLKIRKSHLRSILCFPLQNTMLNCLLGILWSCPKSVSGFRILCLESLPIRTIRKTSWLTRALPPYGVVLLRILLIIQTLSDNRSWRVWPRVLLG